MKHANCVSSRHSRNSELVRLQIEQIQISYLLMLLGSLRVRNILQIVNCPRPVTDTLPSLACQSLSSHKVDTKCPQKKMAQCIIKPRFSLEGCGVAQMTCRLNIITYLCPATDTLPNLACQLLTKFDKSINKIGTPE